MTLPRSAQLLLVSGAFLVGKAALAAAFTQSAALPMTLEHDSNPTLTTIGNKGVTRAIFTPSYNLTTTYGVDEYKLNMGLSVERSSDQQISANRENPNLSFDWQRQAETTGYGLTAKYDEASTRFAELQEAGLIQADGKRKTSSVRGNWSKSLSERNTLAAEAEYKNVVYEGGTLTDYANTSAGFTYNHTWSDFVESFLRAGASHFEPSRTTTLSSNNVNVMGGIKWMLLGNLDWTVQAGPSRTTGQTRNIGWQGSSVLHYLGQRYDASLNVGRSVSASGEGGYSEADHVKGAWGYAIDEKTRTGLEATWQKNRSLNPNTLQQFSAWISRELSPSWNTRLSYQYKQLKQDVLGDATANVLGVTLVYSLPNF